MKASEQNIRVVSCLLILALLCMLILGLLPPGKGVGDKMSSIIELQMD